MSNEVLKISNLVKKHDNSDRVILNNLDLTINDEDFLCILGPSGCGKSTLIRCIAGFEDYEGNIKVDGQPVVKPGPDRIMVPLNSPANSFMVPSSFMTLTCGKLWR